MREFRTSYFIFPTLYLQPQHFILPESMNSKTPNFDSKIKAILDSTQPGERVCVATGEKWVMGEREIEWYRKFNVPPSKYSPLTRQKLAHSYFIIFDIWYNKHAETGEPIISNIHPATGIRVLPDKEWFEQDFLSHGRSLDIKEPFFDQLYELSRSVPRAAGYNYVPPKNSISFISFGDQDSYFVLACKSKRTFYSVNAYDVEDCAELTHVNNAQNCYNILRSDRVFNCRFLHECKDCLDCNFLFDCRNCEHCFGATNKRNKKYLFFNEQLTKEEWENRVSKIDLCSYKVRSEYERQYDALVNEAIWPENFNINAEDSAGEYLVDVSNCVNCYYTNAPGSRDCEDCTYFEHGASHDCYNIAAPINASYCYYGIGTQGSNLLYAMSINVECQNCEYCELCYDCEYCFGCVGLRHKKYCILNRQYTEDEYWGKLDELKCAMLDRGEYGDLPLAYFSTQVFSGSGAALMFGADEKDARALRAAKIEPSDEGAEGPEVDPAFMQSLSDIPNRLDEVNTESIAGKPFFDEKIGRRFSYLKLELELYQKLGIAPPRKHSTARVYDMEYRLNMPIFNDTNCAKCDSVVSVALNRTYPNRTIYCKTCYLKYLEKHG